MDGELFLQDDTVGLGLPAESERTTVHPSTRLWGWVMITTIALWAAVAATWLFG